MTTTETKAGAARREKAEAVEQLREILAPGMYVYTCLRHVSRSGMARSIDLYVMEQDEGRGCYPRRISHLVARACGYKLDHDRGGVKVGGVGMDMGFHLVYGLGRTLYPEAFECVGERCPSNDHSNGDRDYTPHRHSDGGYALRHDWL